MKKFKENSLLFLIGSTVYSLIEIIWRGYTHWTMGIAGGICFLIFYKWDFKLKKLQLWKKCILGSIVITTIELIFGIIVNIKLKMKVWDYSKSPFNFLGQICLPFTLLWFLLSAPALGLCRAVRSYLTKNQIKHYTKKAA